MNNFARGLTAFLSYLDHYCATCQRYGMSLPDEATFCVQDGRLVIRLYRDGSVLPEYAEEILLPPRETSAPKKSAKGRKYVNPR